MLLDIKKIFGTYDEPVTAALELDLSEEDFPGYTVPGTVEARITATLQGRMLEIALDITADVAFACARCLEERTRRFHVIKTYCVREADLSDPDAELSFTPDGVLTILFAFALARWQTNRLIKPINELDLERPLDSDIYEELSPLLEAMDRQNREKEAVANMRKEFSANVSHELKTPLTSISGYAEIMKNGLVRPEDISGFSERIYKEARRLITLIEDIIKLSKLDEESVELEKEDVDLYELTREIVSRLSPQAAQKNIRIELSGESVHYHGIRQILDEMVYNVCENAVKYNYENGKVSVWAGNTLNGPKISVSDTGIGIPKEHQERIFERFYRVDKSHSKERGGTGLGLSIVKHGALLHGAKVSVESEEGRGTKISMQFPRICQK